MPSQNSRLAVFLSFFAFLAALFSGCEYYNLPLKPFIAEHAAEVSVGAVTFIFEGNVNPKVYGPRNGVYTIVSLPAGDIAVTLSLENPMDLRLGDFSWTATPPGSVAQMSLAGDYSVEAVISGARLGDRVELRFNVKAHTNRVFHLSAPAIEFSTGAAKTGNVAYETLAEAIQAASAGTPGSPAVIEILRDIGFPEEGKAAADYAIDGKHVKLAVPAGRTYAFTRAEDGGAFFTVNSGSSLTLEGNGTGQLILDGGKDSSRTASGPLVHVDGGVFTMNAGAVLQNNNNTGNGGGVSVTGGTFNMAGGAVSGNSAAGGKGVYVDAGGAFKMSGGAVVDAGNEVYLASGKTVEIASDLSGAAPVAAIKLAGADYTENRRVLDGTAVFFTEANIAKFALEDYNNESWIIRDIGTGAGAISRMQAKLGGVYYQTLAAAVSAATGTSAAPGVITVLANINLDNAAISAISGAWPSSPGKYIKLTVPQNQTKTLKRVTNNSDTFFTVNAGSSLTLEGNGTGQLILDGGGAAAQTTVSWQRPVVTVAGGEFRMKAGTVIKDNYADMPAVYVTGGDFIMDGGEISGNKKVSVANWRGGGVIVTGSGASFTMNGGEIKDNTAYNGGGVQVGSGASFTMNGGGIKNNTATTGGNGWRGQGGGVFVSVGGEFIMNGGEIRGNTVVYTAWSGSDPHRRGGGGVLVMDNGTFTMKGGSIQGNTIPADPAYNGKGVLIADGTFNIEGAAAINADNDVYLFNSSHNARITITGNLTGSRPVATITPEVYGTGLAVLGGSIISNNCAKFAVRPNGTQNWTIDGAGNLQTDP
jgi:hypothetical protein